jgi:hypothetical protein
MRTTDTVRELALSLAAVRRDDTEAVGELVETAMGRRVAVVMARQELEHVADAVNPEIATRTASLLDRALEAGAWRDSPSG